MNQDDINWIKENWDLIPDDFKANLKPTDYTVFIPGVEQSDTHHVILLLDRQKPSVERCYDFDEERIGVNRVGQVIWGFDSGCSCPSPWIDNYDEKLYRAVKTWKEFIVNVNEFDIDWEKECDEKIAKIKKEINK